MILQVWCVRDKAVGAYMAPFYARSRGEALRSFMDASADANRFAKHAPDYDLYYLGTFDDATGLFVQGADNPERVMNALEVNPHEISSD